MSLPSALSAVPSHAARFEPIAGFDFTYPPLPRTMLEVSRMLVDQPGDADVDQLVDIVHTDPIIAAMVLRRVNSAYYGLRRRVGEIRQAINLLGFSEVTNLVLSAGMMKLRDIVRSPEQEEIFDQLLHLSLAGASIHDALCTHLVLPHRREAFTLGLFSTIGRLLLLYNVPDDYEALWFTCGDDGLPTTDNEQVIFGTDHLELGAQALEAWKLPERFAVLMAACSGKVASPSGDVQLAGEGLRVAMRWAEAVALERAALPEPDVLGGVPELTGRPADDLQALLTEQAPVTRRYVEAMLHG